jgi:hypothetical protein
MEYFMKAINTEKREINENMMIFIKFIGKLPKSRINYNTRYSTACPVCKGKFIFSKTSYNGHMSGGCSVCKFSFTE